MNQAEQIDLYKYVMTGLQNKVGTVPELVGAYSAEHELQFDKVQEDYVKACDVYNQARKEFEIMLKDSRRKSEEKAKSLDGKLTRLRAYDDWEMKLLVLASRLNMGTRIDLAKRLADLVPHRTEKAYERQLFKIENGLIPDIEQYEIRVQESDMVVTPTTYKPGSRVRCVITRVTDSYALAATPEGRRAILHMNEIPDSVFGKLNDHVIVGNKYDFYVLVDMNGRVELTLRDPAAAVHRGVTWTVADAVSPDVAEAIKTKFLPPTPKAMPIPQDQGTGSIDSIITRFEEALQLLKSIRDDFKKQEDTITKLADVKKQLEMLLS